MEFPQDVTPPEKPKTAEENARETLSEMYLMGERFLLDSMSQVRGVMRSVGDTSEEARREQYQIGNEENKFRDSASALGEQLILLFVPEEGRQAIKGTALNAAKDFWARKLEEPDLSPDVIMLGRRRITQLTQRLEEFTKPPEPSQ